MRLAGSPRAVAMAVSVVLAAACAAPTPSPTVDGPLADLWLPAPENRDPQEVERWSAGREILFVDLVGDPWPVPLDPDWDEDPFASPTWTFRYHSLQWLQAPAHAFEQTGLERYRTDARDLLLDWIADNPRGQARSDRAWYGHAVAIRTDMMVWLSSGALRGALSGTESATLRAALAEHGRVLRGYLDEPRFIGHNQNLYHAFSLYNLAVAFPELDPGEWRSSARARISALLTEMVDDAEGASTEQSAKYHGLAVRLFSEGERVLAAHGDGLSDAEQAVLARMARFGLLLTQPDGTLPAIGDTRYADPVALEHYRAALELADDPDGDRLLAALDGADATEVPTGLFVFPNTGWAIFRAPGGEAGIRDDLHLVLRGGPTERLQSHGHMDGASVTLFADGVPWLVDTGGPHERTDAARDDILAPWSHNTVVVDRQLYQPGPVAFSAWDETDDLAWIVVEHDKSPGVHHRRVVCVIGGETVVIVDRLTATDDARHLLEQLLHLAPDVALDPTPAPTTPFIVRQGSAAMEVWLAGSDPLAIDTVVDQREPLLLGVVTPGLRELIPAPVLRATQRSAEAWFVTVLRPYAASRPAAVYRVEAIQSGIRIAVDAGEPWTLTVPVDAAPSLGAATD